MTFRTLCSSSWFVSIIFLLFLFTVHIGGEEHIAYAIDSGAETGEIIPAAPSELSLVLAVDQTSITLSWKDNSSNELDFKIFRKLSSGNWEHTGTVEVNATSYTDSTVFAGTFEYRINACNVLRCSIDSNTAFVTVTAASASSIHDTTAPILSEIQAVNVIGPGAQITWITDDLSTSRVIFGTSSGTYPFSSDVRCDSGGNVTSHCVNLAGLTPDTVYYYKAESTNNRGLNTQSPEYQFRSASGEVSETPREPQKEQQTQETTILNPQSNTTEKSISGTVLFSDGKPISDAEVGAYNKDSQQWISNQTNSRGEYRLQVGSGAWIASVYPASGSTATWSWSGEPPQAVFANDPVSETKVINFTIPTLSATIIALAYDENNVPIQNAGTLLNTTSTLTATDSQFQNSDAYGAATFSVDSGTYYIRMSVFSELGLINPEEQMVEVNAGQVKEIKFIFRKLLAAQTTRVNGTATLDSGTPVEAFVWAWSEQGSFAEAYANAKGEFELTLLRSDRWHLGAAKDVGGFPYESTPLVLNAAETPFTIAFVLIQKSDTPLPRAVTTKESSNEQIITELEDGAKVSIPPNAAASTGTVSVEVKPTTEAPLRAETTLIGTIYDITIIDSNGNKVRELKDEIEITIPYDEKELQSRNLAENMIIPSFFDETVDAWISIANHTIDTKNNIAIARVTHLTRFAIVSAADVIPPEAPTFVKGSQKGDTIELSWQNPLKDFSHVKIYRSNQIGMIGTVHANEVADTTYVDENVQGKTMWYYVVRAVDPAGNESSNIRQTAVSISGGTNILILRTLTVGSAGEDVKVLQSFLFKEGMYPEGKITGMFGPLTNLAVIRFQEKYAAEILFPNGFTQGTGIVGPSTRKKINQLLLAPGQTEKLEIFRNLSQGLTGEDVKTLQNLLLKEAVYPEGLITGFFGQLTKQAVIRFQEKYAAEILFPNGFTQGTGIVGPSTRKKINEFLSI